MENNFDIMLDETYAVVGYDKKLEVVTVVWNGFATSEQYRNALNNALVTLNKYKAKLWLADMTLAKVVAVEDQDWTRDALLPQAQKNGLEKIAFLVSEDLFNKYYTDRIKESIETLDIKYFKTETEARIWLSNS